ncbi:Tannase/feruloyl esterase [Xylaria digitata]|nr:Tannase/feruloyl esterase [Xylaria digitata]
MYASLLAACVPATFSGLSLFSGEITSLETTLVSNYSASVPSAYRFTAPSTQLINATFCNVTVSYTHPGQNDDIRVEAWLPTNNWNERFQAVGGGGWVAGRFYLSYVGMQGALADGYATITTDAGLGSAMDASPWAHVSPGNVNLYNLQNLASVSLNDEAIIGKQLVKSYYGKGPRYSYWNGCSQGGRQGMMLAQRYPDAYDGIAAGAPAFYWTEFVPSTTWPQQVLSMLGQYPYNCETDALNDAAIKACDKLDQVEDGIISRPNECLAHFDPFQLVGMPINCAQTNGTVRVTEAAAILVNETWHGPRAVDGTKLWHGLNPGADITGDAPTSYAPGVAATNCTGTTCVGISNILGQWTQLFVSKNPALDVSNLTHEEWDDLFRSGGQQYRSLVGSADPDLRAFSKRGGKILSFHGVQDNIISLGGSQQYYNAVASISPNIHEFYRLFEVPGLGHCFGGRSQQPTGLFEQLRLWVENDKAPETSPINVTDVTGSQVIGSRVLCPYPQQQQLVKGCKDTAAAKCWTCTKRRNAKADLSRRSGSLQMEGSVEL